ncbi:MAG TPA: chorismate mutase [Caulobacteraceae bacterium]|nr:chorismate mutase [Caulobacteraceae bacterium]
MSESDDPDARLFEALNAWSASRRDVSVEIFAPSDDAIRTRALLGDASETSLIAWRALNARTSGLEVIALWGGNDPMQVADLTRRRFGFHAMLQPCATPEAAMAAAKGPGCAAVLALDARSAWWGRLLVEPRLQVFALLPETRWETAVDALAVAEVTVEPTGADETLWITDATATASEIEAALAEAGFAARWIAAAGGLKLFGLAGYVQRQDPRLRSAPGRLNGVIGAAASPYPV